VRKQEVLADLERGKTDTLLVVLAVGACKVESVDDQEVEQAHVELAISLHIKKELLSMI
jgi:hypothetical protein